jgi:hypothetical protein
MTNSKHPKRDTRNVWLNNGRYFIHVIVHPSRVTKIRVRRSLHRKRLCEALRKRDRILGFLARRGVLSPTAKREVLNG